MTFVSRSGAIGIMVGLAILFPLRAEAQQDPALLTRGAEVYLETCGRCHNVRPASERTDREWVAIVLHMRARANLSKTQADAVLAFLQATNVAEAGQPVASRDSRSRPADERSVP